MAQTFTDPELLSLCGLPDDASKEAVEAVKLAEGLVKLNGQGRAGAAVALASAIGLACPPLTQFPFGYEGPMITRDRWIRRDDLERTLAVLGGLVVGSGFRREAVEMAILECLRDFWLEEKRYDAWRPGMPSGSGWTLIVRPTDLGLARARDLGTAPPPPDRKAAGLVNKPAGWTSTGPVNKPDGWTSTGPVNKPDGWTRGELIAQANHDVAKCSETTFDNIRKASEIPPAAKGGAGAQRRFSVSQLRKLIAAAEAGTFRDGQKIADAWRKLLPDS